MGSSRFWLKDADEESKSISHELPRSHWLKATGQCVIERYLSATMLGGETSTRQMVPGSIKIREPILVTNEKNKYSPHEFPKFD